MNADERTPGQQGYGEQSPQQSQGQQQPASQQQQQQPSAQQQGQATQMSEGEEGGSMATGQASYGNSAETDTMSQNSSSFGQDSDLGQSGQQGQSGGDGSLFRGSDDDLGSSGQTTGQQGSGDQDFAEQGQGALNEDLMGSDEDGGTTDIEVERSQGRESDIEGSSL